MLSVSSGNVSLVFQNSGPSHKFYFTQIHSLLYYQLTFHVSISFLFMKNFPQIKIPSHLTTLKKKTITYSEMMSRDATQYFHYYEVYDRNVEK